MKAVVINLSSSKNKLALFRNNNFPFEVERFDAIVDTPRDSGCAKSHLAVLSGIAEFPTAVFEDDCLMLKPWEFVENAILQLPDGWDALWLGATLHSPLDRYSENLFRIKNAHALHAVIYNSKRMVDYVLNYYNPAKVKYIDGFYAYTVQHLFNCFITYPIAATQMAGVSDISEFYVDYNQEIMDRYERYTR
jgi:GR25 family glycosyltransferase involved in LPS biosynthesis